MARPLPTPCRVCGYGYNHVGRYFAELYAAVCWRDYGRRLKTVIDLSA